MLRGGSCRARPCCSSLCISTYSKAFQQLVKHAEGWLLQGTAVLLEFMRKSYLCVRQTGYMNISQMRLEQLPKEVLSLGNLQHLQARGNVILHISSAMSQMNCIRKLHLHGNGLLYLPPEVGQLVTLVELRLAHNRLKVRPHTSAYVSMRQ